MSDAQLDAIETALGIVLPADYRRTSREFPFRPVGNDAVYWMYDDPNRVIRETLYPLEDGGYNRTGWRDGFVVIGHSPAGDPYLLDTTAAGSPVHCLSHETHTVEPEWPTFEAFVEEWLRFPAEAARQAEAASQARRDWYRRAWRILGVTLLLAIVLPLVVLLLIEMR